jgi:hypothetical protein
MVIVHSVIKFSVRVPVFWDVTYIVGKLVPTILQKICCPHIQGFEDVAPLRMMMKTRSCTMLAATYPGTQHRTANNLDPCLHHFENLKT